MLTNGHFYLFRVLFSTVIRDILLILSTFFNHLWSRSENPLLSTVAPLFHRGCPNHLIYCYLFLVVEAFYHRSSRDIQASAPRIAIYTVVGQTTELLGIASSPYGASTCEAPYRNSPFPVSAYIGSGSSISELGRLFKRRILLRFLAKRGSCSLACTSNRFYYTASRRK